MNLIWTPAQTDELHHMCVCRQKNIHAPVTVRELSKLTYLLMLRKEP